VEPVDGQREGLHRLDALHGAGPLARRPLGRRQPGAAPRPVAGADRVSHRPQFDQPHDGRAGRPGGRGLRAADRSRHDAQAVGPADGLHSRARRLGEMGGAGEWPGARGHDCRRALCRAAGLRRLEGCRRVPSPDPLPGPGRRRGRSLAQLHLPAHPGPAVPGDQRGRADHLGSAQPGAQPGTANRRSPSVRPISSRSSATTCSISTGSSPGTGATPGCGSARSSSPCSA